MFITLTVDGAPPELQGQRRVRQIPEWERGDWPREADSVREAVGGNTQEAGNVSH